MTIAMVAMLLVLGGAGWFYFKSSEEGGGDENKRSGSRVVSAWEVLRPLNESSQLRKTSRASKAIEALSVSISAKASPGTAESPSLSNHFPIVP